VRTKASREARKAWKRAVAARKDRGWSEARVAGSEDFKVVARRVNWRAARACGSGLSRRGATVSQRELISQRELPQKARVSVVRI
jgi:hypothetical protein